MSRIEILLATHNPGKVRDFQQLMGERFLLRSLADEGLAEPEETEDTFLGNCLIKAKAAWDAKGGWVLADDSGFCVDVLDGEPGVYTANWAEMPDGSRNFLHAMEKIKDAVLAKGGSFPARSSMHSCLVLISPKGEIEHFTGKIDGYAVWPLFGTKGFGVDPMFMPDGHQRTLGEMDLHEKAPISHRGRAVKALLDSGVLDP